MLYYLTFSSRNVLDGRVLDPTNFCTRSIMQKSLHTGVLACDLLSRRVSTVLESRTRHKRGNLGFSKTVKDIHHDFSRTCLDLSQAKVVLAFGSYTKEIFLVAKQSAHATVLSPKAEPKTNGSCVRNKSVDGPEILIMVLKHDRRQIERIVLFPEHPESALYQSESESP